MPPETQRHEERAYGKPGLGSLPTLMDVVLVSHALLRALTPFSSQSCNARS